MTAKRLPSTDRVRGTYLGGHEVAALVGANPYQTPADVYARLALRAPSSPPSKAMVRGQIIEPGLLDHIEGKRGVKLDRDVFFLDVEAHLGGSLDALEPDGKTLHEVTTCGERSRSVWGPSETSECSPLKRAQSLYYMGLSGAVRAEVWCLDLSTDDLLHYVIERDDAAEEAIAALLHAGTEFWARHIAPRIPPAPFDGWGTSEHLDLVYPGPPPGTVVDTPATEAIVSACARYDAARAAAKVADTEKAETRDLLHRLLGDASRAQWEGGRVTLSRAELQPATDWAEVAITLRDELRIPLFFFSTAVERCTHPRASSRRLDVRLTKR